MVFKSDTAKKIMDLENEKERIWDKISQLQSMIEAKTQDYEKEARQASKKASEFRNRSEDARNAAQEYLNEIKPLIADIKSNHKDCLLVKDEINDSVNKVAENVTLVTEHRDNVIINIESVTERINEFNSTINNAPNIQEQLSEIQNSYDRIQDVLNKINASHKNISKRKEEIDQVYYEIMGYTDNEDEESEHVQGLRDQLAESYLKIKQDLNTLQTELSNFKEDTIANYNVFREEKCNQFSNIETEWKDKFGETLDKIESLLPKALTAGLSSAYSQKKADEIKESKSYYSKFFWSVIGLILVSLIPFVISVLFLVKGTPIQEIVFDVPRLVLAITPLYIPILWLAYSANKKVNLSKRLIEEYTHKEVLSKTFEGLSKQIEKIDSKKISSDLRNKLLFNILDVSSENPGKLISDYEKTDHPLMDALDKSIKLGNAVEKLVNIPGFSKMASTLDKKSKAILQEQSNKAETGLSHIETSISNEKEKDVSSSGEVNATV